MSQTNDVHSIKSEIKSTFSLSLPLVSSQMVYACSGFVGTAMVARLGAAALAASVLVSMVWMSLSVLFFGVMNSTSILVSHQYGAKNDKAISRIMGQAYILGMIICAILIFIIYSLPFLLHLSSQPYEVLQLAYQYAHALLWTIPGLVILVISEQFLAAVNRAKLVLRISLMIVPVEILLIYILIFGKLGLPACGIAGVGYGFATTYTITAIGLIFYLSKSKRFQRFQIFSEINKIDIAYLKELIRIGLPMGIMHAIEVGAFAIATFWIGHFGTVILAAHQIVLQYLSFAITLVFAMSQAVTIRVGHAVGRQDLSGVKYASYVGVLLNFCCVLLIALVFFLFPHFFLRLDLNIHDPQNLSLINYSSDLLAIISVLLIFDNFRIIGFGALLGIKDTRFPMYASFISFWLIGLTSAFLLGFHFNLHGRGIWWGLTFGIACGAIIVFSRLQYLLRRIDLSQLLHKDIVTN